MKLTSLELQLTKIQSNITLRSTSFGSISLSEMLNFIPPSFCFVLLIEMSLSIEENDE